jgi:hypothetical protein
VTTPAHASEADGRDLPPTFVRPDLGSFCRLDELGLQVVGQRLEPGRAVLACRVVEGLGVRVIGVDEHCWRHTGRGDTYVTVIIDLTPIRDGTGPARLLDMVEGRSKQVFKTWLGERDTSWRDGVEVVAMDGCTVSRPPPARNRPTRSR